MADPLSLTTSVIAILGTALQSVQFLYKTIQDVKSLPETLKATENDLRVLESVLQGMQRLVHENNFSDIILRPEVIAAARNCQETCTSFHKILNHWTRRSKEDQMFWRDKWRIVLFGEKTLEAFKAQVHTNKSTLTFAMTTSVALTMAKDMSLRQETRDKELFTIEESFRAAFARMELQQLAVNQAITDLSTGHSHPKDDAEVEESMKVLRKELQQQKSANENLWNFCDEARNTVHYSRTGQSIKSVHADDGIALAGLVNITDEEMKSAQVRQTINGVSAIRKGTTVAGWVNMGTASEPPGDLKTGPMQLSQEIFDVKSENSGTTIAGVVKGFDFSRMNRT